MMRVARPLQASFGVTILATLASATPTSTWQGGTPGAAELPPSAQNAREQVEHRIGSLGAVPDPCAVSLLLSSKAWAIIEDYILLSQRMDAYAELRGLTATVRRRALPSSPVPRARCDTPSDPSGVRIRTHARVLDLRWSEISAAKAAFARYRMAAGH